MLAGWWYTKLCWICTYLIKTVIRGCHDSSEVHNLLEYRCLCSFRINVHHLQRLLHFLAVMENPASVCVMPRVRPHRSVVLVVFGDWSQLVLSSEHELQGIYCWRKEYKFQNFNNTSTDFREGQTTSHPNKRPKLK